MARVRTWLEAAGIAGGPMFQRLDKAGPATRPTEHRVRSGHRPATCRRGRDRGPRVRPLATGRRGAVPSPPPGPRSSKCRTPADGNPPRCPAAMPGASSPPVARWPGGSPPLRSARTTRRAYEGAFRRLQGWLAGPPARRRHPRRNTWPPAPKHEGSPALGLKA